jgi:hypothetical protein
MSKVSITGNASGSGTFTLAAPNSNSDRTLTLPDNTGTILTSATTTGFPAGSVLQVLSTPKTDTFSTASGSAVDITGLSVTITPTSNTSKVLVLLTLGGLNVGTDADTAVFVKILRGATEIAQGSGGSSSDDAMLFFRSGSTNITFGGVCRVHLDSPATTSATTYKAQLYSNGTTATINGSASRRTESTITVMEIAA